jgi:hypothetical protein
MEFALFPAAVLVFFTAAAGAEVIAADLLTAGFVPGSLADSAGLCHLSHGRGRLFLGGIFTHDVKVVDGVY